MSETNEQMVADWLETNQPSITIPEDELFPEESSKRKPLEQEH